MSAGIPRPCPGPHWPPYPLARVCFAAGGLPDGSVAGKYLVTFRLHRDIKDNIGASRGNDCPCRKSRELFFPISSPAVKERETRSPARSPARGAQQEPGNQLSAPEFSAPE